MEASDRLCASLGVMHINIDVDNPIHPAIYTCAVGVDGIAQEKDMIHRGLTFMISATVQWMDVSGDSVFFVLLNLVNNLPLRWGSPKSCSPHRNYHQRCAYGD